MPTEYRSGSQSPAYNQNNLKIDVAEAKTLKEMIFTLMKAAKNAAVLGRHTHSKVIVLVSITVDSSS